MDPPERDILLTPALPEDIGRAEPEPVEKEEAFGGQKVDDVSWIKPFLHDPVINPHPYKYTLNPSQACQEDVFLLVYVHSHPANSHRRGVIRNTWGNPSNFPVVPIKVVFILGTIVGKEDLEMTVQLESMEFDDIVQENFLDAYENMTLKAVSALKWISSYCSNAKYVMKTDDDALINMYTVVRHLLDLDESNVYNHKLLLCRVWWKMDVSRNGKWAVPEKVIPDNYYPPYCSGIMYVMSMDVALVLYHMSLSIKPFWVDDVYITGLIPRRIGLELSDFIWAYAPVGELDKYYVEGEWYKYAYTHINNMTLLSLTWNRIYWFAHEAEIPRMEEVSPGKIAKDYKIVFHKAKQEADIAVVRSGFVYPHNYNRVLEPTAGCEDDIFLVNFIYTEPEQTGRRRLLRTTWAQDTAVPGFKMKTIFVSGFKTGQENAKENLELEAEDHGDILLEDFDDSFRNQHLKSLGALKWIAEKCSKAKYVLKADDDTMVNMLSLSQHLQDLHSVEQYRTGLVMCNRLWTVMPVAREGLYAVPEDVFPEDKFPPYCSGLGWVVSGDVALRIIEASYHLKPPFVIDDALVTGLYVREMKDVKHYDLKESFVETDDMADRFNGVEWYKYLFSHVYRLVDAKAVWTKLQKLQNTNPAPKFSIIKPGWFS